MSPSAIEAGLDPVMIIRRSTRSLIPVLFILGFSLVFVGALSVMAVENDPASLSPILSDWLLVLPVAAVFEFVRRSSNSLYLFNPRYLTATLVSSGRIDLENSLPYTHIHSIETKQSVLGKFLNYGDIQVSNASGKTKIALRGVRAPRKVEAILNELRTERCELVRVHDQVFVADRAYQVRSLRTLAVEEKLAA